MLTHDSMSLTSSFSRMETNYSNRWRETNEFRY